MAARSRPLTETDEAIWASFASRIVPLPGRRAVAAPAAAPPVAVEKAVAERQPGSATDARPAMPRSGLGVGEQPAGIDKATWRRFKTGKLGSIRKLDLHGMTARDAFAALRGFLRAAQADGVRCVEIVTGRGSGEGGGVLRRELPHWLSLPEIRPMILAAAHPHTSNALHVHIANPGSVRVLLRRPRT